MVPGAQQLLGEPKILASLLLSSQILRAPRSIPEIHAIYTPKHRKDCGFELTTAPQSQLLIAGEHPIHLQPLNLATFL